MGSKTMGISKPSFEDRLRQGVDGIIAKLRSDNFSYSQKRKYLGDVWVQGERGIIQLLERAEYGSLLFLRVSPNGDDSHNPLADEEQPLTCLRGTCGCLTQVRDQMYPAYSPKLTRAIQADLRLPTTAEKLFEQLYDESPQRMREILEPFVEWQLKLREEFKDLEWVEVEGDGDDAQGL